MIKVKKMNVIYENRNVLSDVTVNFRSGTISLISGASGSGKTSFLNILGLIQKANSECEIEFNDLNLLDLDKEEKASFVKNNIGYIFQNNNLISSLNVFDNVALQLTSIDIDHVEIEQIVLEKLKFVGLSEFKDKYPSELSGGEEQRVAIARALAMDQRIILADEPTSALDEENRKIIMDLLFKIAKDENKTVIIASHDLFLVNYADVHYKISNNNFEVVMSKGTNLNIENTLINENQSKTLYPILNFNRKQKKKSVPKTILYFIGIVISVAIIGFNIINSFASIQNQTYNDLSDKSLFIVNDSLSLKQCLVLQQQVLRS